MKIKSYFNFTPCCEAAKNADSHGNVSMPWGWKARAVKVDTNNDGNRDTWKLDVSSNPSGVKIDRAEVSDASGTLQWEDRVQEEYFKEPRGLPYWTVAPLKTKCP